MEKAIAFFDTFFDHFRQPPPVPQPVEDDALTEQDDATEPFDTEPEHPDDLPADELGLLTEWDAHDNDNGVHR